MFGFGTRMDKKEIGQIMGVTKFQNECTYHNHLQCKSISWLDPNWPYDPIEAREVELRVYPIQSFGAHRHARRWQRPGMQRQVSKIS
jgi:hypothetical protein